MSEDFTIEEYLELIKDNAKRLKTFIEGLEVAMTLAGIEEDKIYRVSKFYATATNIVAYCNGIEELKSKKKKGK